MMPTALQLLILIGVLFAADAVTTAMFLKRGLREANPILVEIIERWGMVGLGAAKALAFGIIITIHVLEPLPIWALWGVVVVYAFVVSWNLYQMKVQSK